MRKWRWTDHVELYKSAFTIAALSIDLSKIHSTRHPRLEELEHLQQVLAGSNHIWHSENTQDSWCQSMIWIERWSFFRFLLHTKGTIKTTILFSTRKIGKTSLRWHLSTTSLTMKHSSFVYPKIGICSHRILKRNNRNNAFQMLHYNLSFEQQKLFILNASLGFQ